MHSPDALRHRLKYDRIAATTSFKHPWINKANPHTTPLQREVLQAIKDKRYIKAKCIIAKLIAATHEDRTNAERTCYTRRIIQQSDEGRVWWIFAVEDLHLQDQGFTMCGEELPSVRFVFHPNTPDPPGIPEHVFPEITSYWSVPARELNGGNRLRRKEPQRTPAYRNICHKIDLVVPSGQAINKAYRLTELKIQGGKSGENITTDHTMEDKPLLPDIGSLVS